LRAFCDTNVILNSSFNFSDYEKVIISIITIEELDGLKLSDTVGYLARIAIRKIIEADNVDIRFNYSAMKSVHKFLDHKADNHILSFFTDVYAHDKECVFLTDDYALLIKSRALGLPCQMFEFEKKNEDLYKGYKEIVLSDIELADYYQNPTNQWNLLLNEYLIIRDKNNNIIDKKKWTEKGFKNISSKPFKSIYFPDFKPRDEYQMMAMDSLINDDLTLFFGKPGSGKTMISLSWIMQNIHSSKLGKCVVVFNSVKLKNSESQGFYPGSRNEKLLSTSLGGILSSKFGDMTLVESLIANGKLMLIPTSEVRGIEISEHDCIFITEGQNIDSYTMRTIIQRAKEGCKIIIEGDILEQQDIKIGSLKESGMFRTIEVFKGSKYFSCVKLQNIYRSPIADIAQNI